MRPFGIHRENQPLGVLLGGPGSGGRERAGGNAAAGGGGLSNDGFNRAFDLVTVIPLTKLEGKRRRVYSFEVVLPPGCIGNDWSSIVMPD